MSLDPNEEISKYASSEVELAKADLSPSRFRGSVPDSDYEFSASRSQGAGGQNVDKRSTKAVIRFQIGDAGCLSEVEKSRLRIWIKGKRPSLYIEADDSILVSDSTSRTQGTNRANAVRKLEALIMSALEPKKERIPTEKPKSADEKRLSEKKRRSKILSSRSEKPHFD